MTAPSSPSADSSGPLRVGMIGHAFMGAAHSHAWRSAHRFFDLPRTPVLQVVVGRDEARSAAAAERYGFAKSSTDWRGVVESPEVDLVDICTPGDTHRDIAVAALAAGKHVLCEKPLANSVSEAEEMAAAAETAVAAAYLLWPWPDSWSPRVGWGPSGTSAPTTCRTGCPTPVPR
jgi:predicted dehydrogenase